MGIRFNQVIQDNPNLNDGTMKERRICSVCGMTADRLWGYRWWNGIIVNEKWCCKKCRKNAPPINQFKAHDGRILEWSLSVDAAEEER